MTIGCWDSVLGLPSPKSSDVSKTDLFFLTSDPCLGLGLAAPVDAFLEAHLGTGVTAVAAAGGRSLLYTISFLA